MTSIASTEKTLNGITRKLSDQEQKTAAQIREFLKQAREALTAGDVDGARTLACQGEGSAGRTASVALSNSLPLIFQ